MNSKTSTLYKLIVLYMLDKADYPLTNANISDLILGKEYTNYFVLQQSISELETSDLIAAESNGNTTYYRITPEGQVTLEYFQHKISDEIKNDILEYFSENHIELKKKDTSVSADYYKAAGNLYNVRCQIKEKNKSVFELSFQIQGLEQAKAACENWKKQNEDIYAYLMDMLIQ